MKPQFVLGVGAAKAGTSWLSSFLRHQPDANFGAVKEYHVWDYHFGVHMPGPSATDRKRSPKKRALLQRLREHPETYGEYFASLIDDGIDLTGDITPSYALLNADQYAHIRDVIWGAGFDLRVVFLMRDPVARTWSSRRMAKKRRMNGLPGQSAPKLTDEKLERFLLNKAKRPSEFRRGDYATTVTALDAAFAPEQLHFDFYERLFQHDAVERLSEFLGRPLAPPEFETRINPSPDVPLSPQVRNQTREVFAATYRFCGERFPVTQGLWDFDLNDFASQRRDTGHL